MGHNQRKSIFAKLSGKLEQAAIGETRTREQRQYMSGVKPLAAEQCRGQRYGRIYAGPVDDLRITQTKPHKAHQEILRKVLTPLRKIKSIGEYDAQRTR